jgi:hypothetical protein
MLGDDNRLMTGFVAESAKGGLKLTGSNAGRLHNNLQYGYYTENSDFFNDNRKMKRASRLYTCQPDITLGGHRRPRLYREGEFALTPIILATNIPGVWGQRPHGPGRAASRFERGFFGFMDWSASHFSLGFKDDLAAFLRRILEG